MSVLSKLLMADYSLPYNCYEIGHTFTPYCTESSVTISSSVLRESLKMYSLLYFLTHLVFVRKFGYANFKNTFQSIFRSTSFLTFNSLSTLSLFCLFRHLTGKFYLPIVSHLPAIISSFLSLRIERVNRRSALAFYCCNLAMETIIFGELNSRNNVERFNKKHNIAPKRKLAQNLDTKMSTGFLALIFDVFRMNGDEFKKTSMYIFGLTSIIYLSQLKSYDQKMLQLDTTSGKTSDGKKKEHSDLVYVVFRYLIGENDSDLKSLNDQHSYDNLVAADLKPKNNLIKEDMKSLAGKLFSCSHCTSSDCLSKQQVANCIRNSASCSLRGLTIGFLTNFTLIFAMHLKNNKFKLSKSFWSLLFDRENFKFSLLLGSFNGFYKLFNCLFHRIETKKSNWHSAASSVSSIILSKLVFGTKIASPNLNLIQYLFWKSVENWFWHFARAHQERQQRIHEKYLRMIDEKINKRNANRLINENDSKESSSNNSNSQKSNINLNTHDLLTKKINKLSINDTIQLNELVDKLTQLESRQQFSIFNYISSDNIVSFIYSLSVSQLFYVAVMQPLKLRGSYMKFLDRFTDNRLRLLNRNIIDFFGVQSSAGTIPHEPVLDFEFTSRKFQEAVQVWTI